MTYSRPVRFLNQKPMISHAENDRPLAISYLRFSTPEQRDGDSTRRQMRAAEVYAARFGLQLADEHRFEDLGVSAFRGRNRETGALGDIVDAVNSGAIPRGTYLLVEGLDRLSRMDPWDASYQLQTLIRAGLIVVTLADNQVYSEETLRGPDGPMRMMVSFMVMMRANEESATKSKRIASARAAGRAAAASSLRRYTRTAPSWLSATESSQAGPEGWNVLEEKASIVRSVFELGRTNLGKASAARRLNEDRVPTLSGGALWHASAVAKLWEQPAVIGTFAPHRFPTEEERAAARREGRKLPRRIPTEPVVEGYYPAIISDELWADVQSRRTVRRPRGPNATRPIVNPLAGVARCGRCGSTVTRVVKGSGSKPKLVCTSAKNGKGCKYIATDLALIELALLTNGLEMVAEAPLGALTCDLEADLRALEATADNKREEIGHLVDAFAKEPSPALRTALRQAEGELAQLKGEEGRLIDEIIQMTPGTTHARMASLEAALSPKDGEETLCAETVASALQRACAAVVVDTDRQVLQFEWKHGGSSTLVFGFPQRSDEG